MEIRNINVNHGLVNGAMGVIRRIDWPALRRQQLEAGEMRQTVFVEFDDLSITGNQVVLKSGSNLVHQSSMLYVVKARSSDEYYL